MGLLQLLLMTAEVPPAPAAGGLPLSQVNLVDFALNFCLVWLPLGFKTTDLPFLSVSSHGNSGSVLSSVGYQIGMYQSCHNGNIPDEDRRVDFV